MRVMVLALVALLGACATGGGGGAAEDAASGPSPFPVQRGTAERPPAAAPGQTAPPEGAARGGIDFGQWRSTDPAVYAPAFQTQIRQRFANQTNAELRASLEANGFACEDERRLDCRIEIMERQCAFDWYVVLERGTRECVEAQTGLRLGYVEQLYTFGALDRDPRERVVTVAYYALAKLSDHRIRAATDAMGVGWFALDELPKLAFDHDDIIARAHERLRGKVRYAPVGFELLPPRFSLTQLQRLYEIILGTALDKRNFRKKILSMDLLVETDEVEQGVRHRAARLYRFDRRKYERLLRQGFELQL